jgi:hypothetical protein
MAVAMAMALWLAACKPADNPHREQTTPAASNAVSEPSQPAAEFTRLLGRWERPDGGYVLEFKSVDAAGKFEAAYYNPSPIHVEQARAETDGSTLKLLVLLRDVNYPGCLYRLTYDAKADQLFGTYFQATMGETYDVAFGRLKAGVGP